MSQEQGPYTFNESQQFTGQVAGDATVARGVSLDLMGQVTGNLYVRAEASVTVSGMVCGAIINEGGDVTVKGVYGGVIDRGATISTIAPNAVKIG